MKLIKRREKRDCTAAPPLEGGAFMRTATRLLRAVLIFEMAIGIAATAFFALTYFNNPYLFDAMAWCSVRSFENRSGAVEFAEIKPGMDEDQVKRHSSVWIIGKRDFSASGELCRETFWDAGKDGSKKTPVCKPEKESATDRVEWSMNMPEPYRKEYEDRVVVFRNGRVERTFTRDAKIE